MRNSIFALFLAAICITAPTQEALAGFGKIIIEGIEGGMKFLDDLFRSGNRAAPVDDGLSKLGRNFDDAPTAKLAPNEASSNEH